MPRSSSQSNQDSKLVADYLISRYGLLLGREALAEVLHFPSASALDRHYQRGHLALPVVRFTGRRGIYALATEVARYLVRSSRDGNSAVVRKERDIEK